MRWFFTLCFKLTVTSLIIIIMTKINVTQLCIKNSSCIEIDMPVTLDLLFCPHRMLCLVLTNGPCLHLNLSRWSELWLYSLAWRSPVTSCKSVLSHSKPSRALALLQSWVSSHSVILSRCNSPALCSWRFSRPHREVTPLGLTYRPEVSSAISHCGYVWQRHTHTYCGRMIRTELCFFIVVTPS